jgi:hypothetical protein
MLQQSDQPQIAVIFRRIINLAAKTGGTMRSCLLLVGCFALALCAGCNSGNQAYHEVPKGARVKDQPHQHEEGPHGGHLVELGEEEYHAEVVLDPKTSKITLYVLDSSAKKAAPIDAKEIQLELTIGGQPKSFSAKAVADKGDPPNKSSRFEVADSPEIKANIKDEEDLKGSVTATIGAKAYSGKIVHEH